MIFYAPWQAITLPSSVDWLFSGSLLLIVAAIYSQFKQKTKSPMKILAIWFIQITILGLLNNRVIKPDVSFYEGFHLLPYLAAWLGLTVTAGTIIWSQKWGRAIVILSLLLTAMNFGQWAVDQRPRLADYTLNYSTQQLIADKINQTKSAHDNFMSGPDGAGFINLVTNLPIPGRQVFHLDWAYRNPWLRQQLTNMFINHPPEYLYFSLNQGMVSNYLKPILAKRYYSVLGPSGNPSNLYILDTKWDSLSLEEKALYQN